jgi:hypothetical protein
MLQMHQVSNNIRYKKKLAKKETNKFCINLLEIV